MPRAYAKLVGTHGIAYYLNSIDVTLGCSKEAGETSETGVLRPSLGLGEHRALSRIHARIRYNETSRLWEFTSESEKGAYIDGLYVGLGYAPVPLMSRTLIQLADRKLYFLLPSDAAMKDDVYNLYYGLPKDPSTYSNASLGLQQGNEPRWIDLKGVLGIKDGEPLKLSFFKFKRGGRERFRTALLCWGFGRWIRIMSEIDDPEITVQDIQLYTLAFLRHLHTQLVLEADEEDSSTAAALDLLILDVQRQLGFFPSVTECDDPSLTEWVSLKKFAKKWASRMVMLYTLQRAIDRYGEKHLLDDVDQDSIPDTQKTMSPLWGIREDLHLLIGVYRHGYGNFDAVLADKSLCFSGRFSADPTSGEEAWPPLLALVGRLKRLTEILAKRDEQRSSKRKLHEMEAEVDKAVEGDDEKNKKLKLQREKRDKMRDKKLKEGAHTWTKRELELFRRAILQAGLPASWAQFQKDHHVFAFKPSDALEVCFRNHVEAMNVVLQEKNQFPHVQELEDPDADSLREIPPGEWKPRTAGLFRDQVLLILRVRDAVQNGILEHAKAGLVARIKSLPDWWNFNSDWALLMGVFRYGYGMWENLCIDTELRPFLRPSASELPENAVLKKRLRMLLDYHAKKVVRAATKSEADAMDMDRAAPASESVPEEPAEEEDAPEEDISDTEEEEDDADADSGETA